MILEWILADGGDQSGNLNNIQTQNEKIRFLVLFYDKQVRFTREPNLKHAHEIRFLGFRPDGGDQSVNVNNIQIKIAILSLQRATTSSFFVLNGSWKR